MPIEPTDPPGKRAYNAEFNLIKLARDVRDAKSPGQWFKVRTYSNRGTAVSTASRLRLTPHKDFPKGKWEIIGRESDNGDCSELYLCWYGPSDTFELVNAPTRGSYFGNQRDVYEKATDEEKKTRNVEEAFTPTKPIEAAKRPTKAPKEPTFEGDDDSEGEFTQADFESAFDTK